MLDRQEVFVERSQPGKDREQGRHGARLIGHDRARVGGRSGSRRICWTDHALRLNRAGRHRGKYRPSVPIHRVLVLVML
jgi:hypothetical protein